MKGVWVSRVGTALSFVALAALFGPLAWWWTDFAILIVAGASLVVCVVAYATGDTSEQRLSVIGLGCATLAVGGAVYALWDRLPR